MIMTKLNRILSKRKKLYLRRNKGYKSRWR